MSYVLTTSARSDIDATLAFIQAAMNNPQGAEVVENYLFEASESIGRNPQKFGGNLRPDITDRLVKLPTFRKYKAIDGDRKEPLAILAAAGGRRDLSRLLPSDPRYSDE